jgi:hypothetical protein
VHDTARKRALADVACAPAGYVVTIAEPARNLDQNAAMWPILQEFSEQLQWPVNGALCRLTPEEWKDILSSAFRRETARVAQGLDGGMVLLGQRTSRFSRREFSEFLDFLHATAAARGVELEPATAAA